ncbi:type II and III secretion system protein family protein [Telluria mixta]|uniref:Type II and III secretion system protein family protein n=1 Tax=Telluria mixta TaxID=34071 RepID=A0ABT2BW01_9BURK|nr:type II and III secretion system protein family protein [Telluria mixta]MCS0629226.1 type II and III secretion system protein family protein [Telluria mixta]WEM97664.1 type II and III secretion system protein family protein [Telluria mixta]
MFAAGLALAATGPAGAAAKSKAQPVDNPTGATPLRAEAGPNCKGEAAKPAQLALQVGKSSLMRLPEPVQHRSVGNPLVVQALMVAPDTLYIAGVDVGTTNMIIQGKSGLCSVVDITVAMDPAALQAMLATAMPDEHEVNVLAASDALVLTGTVSDTVAAARAVELATAYVRRPLRALTVPDKEDATSQSRHEGQNQGGAAAAAARIVNMLSVRAPQQVQLEVKIAEVSKSLLDRLEGGTRWTFSSGSWGAMLLSNFITGTAHGALSVGKSADRNLTAAAEKQDGLVRVLAEPNVMAISGQEGTFLVGGKFYIPVAQDNNRVTLEEKEFGVGLRFTPTVLGGGRINLRVAPEVSELSREGIGLSATGFNGTAILPVVTTRRATTTVQLYDGQSFAIGGLIKSNLVANLKGLPVLGELPVLGALFRSADYQQDRTELVFVITAHLVKPLSGNSYELPTDKVGEPSRASVMLGGRLEGKPPKETTAVVSLPAPATPAAQSPGGFELK